MSAILLGGIIGTIISILAYLVIGRDKDARNDDYAVYFFDKWSLKRKAVAATIFSSAMSLATVVVALLQLGVAFGIALSWATITFCAGWALLGWLAPKIKAAANKEDTIHTFLARTYNSSNIGKFASLATISGLLGLFSMELFAGEIILQIVGVEKIWIQPVIGAFGIVTIIYTAQGGFRSAVHSDILQTSLLCLALLTLATLAVTRYLNHGQPPLQIYGSLGSPFLPLPVMLSLLAINFPFPLVDMQSWQRLLASSNIKEFKNGNLSAIGMFAVTWSLIIVAAILISPTLKEGTQPLAALFDSATTLPSGLPFIVGLFLVPGLFAAMFSSADGFLNSAATTFSLDLRKSQSAPNSTAITRAKRHAAILGTVALLVAAVLKQAGFGVVDLVFAVSAGQLALLPTVIFALFGTRIIDPFFMKSWSFASIVSGFVIAWMNGFYSVSAPGTKHWLWIESHLSRDVYMTPVFALIGSSVVFGVGLAITPTRTSATSRHK